MAVEATTERLTPVYALIARTRTEAAGNSTVMQLLRPTAVAGLPAECGRALARLSTTMRAGYPPPPPLFPPTCVTL